MNNIAVRVDGLCHRYLEAGEPRDVLKDVCLQIHAGEIVSLVGRSGSGKTTLLNLLAGIDYPSAGTVEIAGTALFSLNESERTLFRRRKLGVVFQFFNLIPTLTVFENVVLRRSLDGRVDRAFRSRVDLLLSEVGLAHRRDSFPERMSGGERQRVAIAAALAHEPALVLADEPTGNLDEETGQQVMHLFERLVKAHGHTMVMATHSQTLAAFSDRILTMDHGRVVND